MDCPYCGNRMECDEVDNGVGIQRCGPYIYICDWCHAVEIQYPHPLLPNYDEKLDADEIRTGFYKGDHFNKGETK